LPRICCNATKIEAGVLESRTGALRGGVDLTGKIWSMAGWEALSVVEDG
jgi:hypothetical protein